MRLGVVSTENNDLLAEFTTDELKAGIDQYAQIKLGVSLMDFVNRVRSGEVWKDQNTQDVADLVRVVDGRLADEARRIGKDIQGETQNP